MSRLGKLPIELPQGTEARLEGDFIIVKGPKGELKEKIGKEVKIEINDRMIEVRLADGKDKKAKAFWGLYRSIINNMVKGVKDGFEKKLEINGVGFKAAVSEKKIILHVGFSHPVEYNLPAGISAKIENNIISIAGIDKQAVGEVAAQIRKIKEPEPYKGKGIKYIDEVIRRKAGKTATK